MLTGHPKKRQNKMRISQIFESISVASGHEKTKILVSHSDNMLLRDIIKATYEPHWNYRIKLDEEHVSEFDDMSNDVEELAWRDLLVLLHELRDNAVKCSDGRLRLYEIIDHAPFDARMWMFHVVNRHLNIGTSTKTFNKIWPLLISTFECQLAEKYESTKITGIEYVAIEPKLDGVRCLAFVTPGVETKLFTRAGKEITNFPKLCQELTELVTSPIVLDGELMSADFSAMMGQVFRKTNVDATNVVYNIFDCVPTDMWNTRKCELTCRKARELLEDMNINLRCKYSKLVERRIVRPDAIANIHKGYVAAGLEGSMIKLLDSHYEWKRGWNVMKVKDFFTVELPIASFTEGTGRYKEHLGAFIVYFEGVEVKVERGHLTKQEAHHIWNNRSKFRGELIEINYQEVTRDGSLRLPVFMRFRRDKEA